MKQVDLKWPLFLHTGGGDLLESFWEQTAVRAEPVLVVITVNTSIWTSSWKTALSLGALEPKAAFLSQKETCKLADWDFTDSLKLFQQNLA